MYIQKGIIFLRIVQKVTIYYAVSVGLKDDNGVVYNPGSYLGIGRVPLTSITLKDILTTLKDRNNNTVNPESVSMYKYVEGQDPDDIVYTPVTSNTAIPLTGDLALNTVGTNDQGVDPNAPSITTYIIEAVYPYAPFIAQYYDENQNPLTVENKARIDYTRKGDPQPYWDEETETVSIGEVTVPVALQVSKLIQQYNGTAADTYEAGYSMGQRGKYTFTVWEGTYTSTTAATLYTLGEDGKYTKVTDSAGHAINTITIDLSAADSTGTSSVYYLDPGTYTVKEYKTGDEDDWVIIPTDNTTKGQTKDLVVPEPDKDGNVTITPTLFSLTNKEVLGEFTVRKIDEANHNVGGATFTVYTTQACDEIAMDAAGNQLVVTMGENTYTHTFTRLKYDDYWVKETQAPEGFIINETPVKVTVDANYADLAEIKIKNTDNQADLKLSKQISVLSAAYGNLTSTLASDYAGAFQIQKYNSETSKWEDLGNPIATLTGGQEINYTAHLPIYEIDEDTGEQGDAIQYRIIETVPASWYFTEGAINDTAATFTAGTKTVEGTVMVTYTSPAVTLTAVQGEGDAAVTVAADQKITFKDRKYISVKVTKKFWTLNTSGSMAEDTTAREIQVGLYKKVGDNYVRADGYSSDVTTSGKTYTWNNLPLFDSSNNKIEYYVKEVPVDGFALTDTTVGDNYVRITDPTGSSTQGTVTLNNVEKKVAVKIEKRDANTNALLTGFKATVTPSGSGKVYAADAARTEITGSIDIGAQGTIVYLDINDTYTFAEDQTSMPSGYTFVSVTPSTVALTDYAVSTTQGIYKTIVIKNQTAPKIKVEKYIKNNLTDEDETGTTLTNATFEVYYKNSADEIVPYAPNGTTVTITSNGQEVAVEAGKYYYLHETNTADNNAVNPDKNHDVYGDAVVLAKDGKYVFCDPEESPNGFLVNNQTGTTNTTVLSVTNAKNRGGVRVYKKTWRDKSPQAGATIGLLAPGETTPTSDHKDITAGDECYVEFTDLPVYDDNGQKITYTLKELGIPAGYYPKVGVLTTTLVPGEIIETIDGAAPAETTEDDPIPSNLLVLYNDILTGFNIGKRFFNDWEYQYTQKTYALPGTEVAVYKKIEEKNDQGAVTNTYYEYVCSATTTDNGAVLVTGLEPEFEYVAIEVAIPLSGQGQDHEYLTPTATVPSVGNHTYDYRGYLLKDSTGNVPPTLTSLEGLNYVEREAILESYTEERAEAIGTALHNLYNVEDWAQLDVTKWKAKFKDGADLTGDIWNNLSAVIEEGTAPATSDHAIFWLYVQDLRDHPAPADGVLTFNEAYCEFIKELTSGTFYEPVEGVDTRQPGEFASPVLHSAPWLVYWLIEKKPEIGTDSIPAMSTGSLSGQIVTLYKHPNANVTNGHNQARTVTYKRNEPTEDNILDQVQEPVGGGGLRYMSIRLAKWAAKILGTDYDPEHYDPLGGVTFDLFICDENLLLVDSTDVIDSITVGLDDAGYAGGQSSDFTLIIGEDGSVTSFTVGLRDLTDTYKNYLFHEPVAPADPDGPQDWYFYAAIKETSAPAEYTYDADYYFEKVYFLASAEGKDGGWTFNDAFFVTDADKGTETLAVETQGEDQAYAQLSDTTAFNEHIAARTKGDDHNRIVNYPVFNNPVVVRKYGYTVNSANKGKTNDELDDYYTTQATGRQKLNVEMILYKEILIDGELQWKMWDYQTVKDGKNVQGIATSEAKATFSTENGIFRFPFGLYAGNYRIKEKDFTGDVNKNYINAYDGSDDDHYRYFTVENNTSKRIVVYNPAKVKVVVSKTDPAGNALSGVTFTLTKTTDSSYVPTSQVSGNKTTFTYIDNGNYVLGESGLPTGYTDSYLSTYFHNKYTSTDPLYSFADDTGTWFGVEIGKETVAEGDDGYNRGTIVTNYYDAAEAITVMNPKLVNLKLIKEDEKNHDEKLNGVKFKVYQQLFDITEGTYTVKNPDTPTADGTSATGWTYLGEFETGSGTFANGEISLPDKAPGVYVFIESGVPEDYEYELVNGKDKWWVAVTGGMDISISADSPEMDVYNKSLEDTTAIVTALNRKQAGVSIEKKFTNTSNIDPSKIGNWTADFELGELKTDGTINVFDTVSLNQGKTSSSFTSQLSQGKTYYIRELPSTLFKFSAMKLNDGPMDKVTIGEGEDAVDWYKFTVPSEGEINISIVAENILLRAEIEIQKRDKAFENDDEYPFLPGATFKLYKVVGDNEVEVTDAVWTPLTDEVDGEQKENGKYVVSFPMDSEAAATYRIREETAPTGYLLDQDQSITVTVSPGDHLSEYVDTHRPLYLTNEGGFTIKVKKYDNIYDERENANLLNGAVFALVKWDTATNSWQAFSTKETGKDEDQATGIATFLAQNNTVYGLVELSVPDGYVRLDSIYAADDENPLTADDESFIYSGKSYTVYKLNNGSNNWDLETEYVFIAYNEPYTSFQVRKEDVSGSGILPKATFDVYKVAGELENDDLTDTIIAKIIAGTYELTSQKFRSDQVTSKRKSDDSTYSYINIEDVEGGYTYVIVETRVDAFESGKVYNSFTKDDNRVIWYGCVYVPKGTVIEKDEDYETLNVMLDNVLGKADAAISKTAADPNNRETLFAGPQTVVYTITPYDKENKPNGDNTVGLDSFVVTDLGLKAYHGDANDISDEIFDVDLDGDGTLDALGYSITSVKIGNPTHDPSIYGVDAEDAPIKATVRFYGFDADVNNVNAAWKYETEVGAGEEATLPDTVTDDIKFVRVSYAADDEDHTLSGLGYVLGKDFVPDTITITAELKQQPDGATVETIDWIRNNAKVELNYSKFNNTGVKTPQPTITKTARADIFFVQPPIPVVKVEKVPGAAIATLDGQFYYTIKMTNTDQTIDLKQPFVVDMLPKGTAFVSAEVVEPRPADLGDEAITTLIQGESDIYDPETGDVIGHKDAMTAVRIAFPEGKLAAGKTAQVTITIKVTNQVELFGENIKNYVFMSSEDTAYKSTVNPYGAPFKDNRFDDEYARPITGHTGSVLNPALTSNDANSLVALLKEQGENWGDLGYVSHSVQTPWNEDAKVDPVKTIRADQDIDSEGNLLDFSTSRLAQASNGKAPSSTDEGGWVEYQLALKNTSDVSRSSILIADILPQPGDTQNDQGSVRQSQWKVTFNKIESLEGPDGAVTNYKIYGYKGPASQAYIAINEAMTAWKASNNYETPDFGTSWTLIENAPNTEITAFLIITDTSVVLDTNEIITATLMTDVLYYGDDPVYNEDGSVKIPAFSTVAYQNNVNNFLSVVWDYNNSTHTATVSSPTITSNVVNATLMPDLVQVGGNIWIDANNNGIQDDGTFDEYTNDAIVKMLMENMSVHIRAYNDKEVGRHYNSGGIQTNGTIYDDATVTKPKTYEAPGTAAVDNIYQGEPEFLFQQLKAAMMMGNKPYIGEDLNVAYLKGEAPNTYILGLGISEEADVIWDIVGHAYEDHYMSDDPETMPVWTPGPDPTCQNDNNFDIVSLLSSNHYFSERFYLYPTSKGSMTDMTKDAGFTAWRDLWILKVADDDTTIPLDGAEFKIYGPFDRDTINAGNFDPSTMLIDDGEDRTLIQLIETDMDPDADDGLANKTNLLWYMDYIIVESKAPAGYTLGGGTATPSTDGTTVEKLAENTWILRVPDTDYTPKANGYEPWEGAGFGELITITNPRGVPDVPYVKKTIEGTPIEDVTFEFTLDFADGMDEDLKKYVKFKDTEDVDDDGNKDEYINFTVPQTKYLTIEQGKSDKTEPFFNDGTVEESKLKKIWFLVEGTYKFVIEEVGHYSTDYDPETGAGTWKDDSKFTYDGSKWLYEVKVVINDKGKLVIDSTSYTKIVEEGEESETADQAEFTNEYALRPVDGHLKVTKEIILPEGITALAPGLDDAEFTFTLASYADAVAPKVPGHLTYLDEDGVEQQIDAEDLKVTIKASEVADGKVAEFPNITFTEVGEYQYTITETDSSDDYPWFQFNTTPVIATVKVVDDEDNPGQLKVVYPIEYTVSKDVESTDDNKTAALIENTYEPGQVNFEVSAKKIFQSYTSTPFNFSFTLYRVEGEGNDETETWIQTITITGVTGGMTTEPKAFNAVPLTGKGTYKFRVKEEVVQGVNNTSGQYDYIVTTDWDTDPDSETFGQLVITDIKKNGDSVTDTTATFINEYNLTGYYSPVIHKKLVGRELTEEDDFVFVVRPYVNGNLGNPVLTGHSNAAGSVTWDDPGKLEYHLEDAGKTYYYKIFEKVGDEPGITYGNPSTNPTDEWTFVADVQVSISEDKVNKKLDVVGIVLGDGTFKNYFHAYGEWDPTFFKDLEYRHMLQRVLDEYEEPFDEEYQVTITDTDTQEVVATGTVKHIKHGQPDVTFDFGNSLPIKYTEDTLAIKDAQGRVTGYLDSKEFKYVIKETVIPSNINDYTQGTMTVDDKEITVKVTVKLVKDPDTGIPKPELSVVSDPDFTSGEQTDDNTFVNEYNTNCSITFEGEKTLESDPATARKIKRKEFTFELYEGTKAEGTPIQTVLNGAEAEWADNEFKFEAIPYDLQQMITDEELVWPENTVPHDVYAYKHFVIVEKPVNEDGEFDYYLDYDSTVYSVTVQIHYNFDTGFMEAKKVFTTDGTFVDNEADWNALYSAAEFDTAKFSFTNFYAEAKEQFEGLKYLFRTATEGADLGDELFANQFKFTITALDNPTNEDFANIGHEVGNEKQDAESGKFLFDEMKYTLHDMERETESGYKHPITTYYQYKIEEVVPTDYSKWIDYNYYGLTYYVTVQLKFSRETGKLTTDKVYTMSEQDTSAMTEKKWEELKANDLEKAEFTNFDARTKVHFEGDKSFLATIGSKIVHEDGTFTFAITDEAGNVLLNEDDNNRPYVVTVTVKAGETMPFEFDDILYDLSDMYPNPTGAQHPASEKTFTYYIKEVMPTGTAFDDSIDYNYDNSLYKVVVTLTYAKGVKELGQETDKMYLNASWVYHKVKQDAETPAPPTDKAGDADGPEVEAKPENVEFTNYYGDISIQFEGTKLLNRTQTNTAGLGPVIAEDQFTFKLTTVHSPHEEEIEQTKTNKIKTLEDGTVVGTITFDPITYTLHSMDRDGTDANHPLKTTYYEYKIEEILPENYNHTIDYNYNDLTYYVLVKLTYEKDADGKMNLTADKRYSLKEVDPTDKGWNDLNASKRIPLEFTNYDARTDIKFDGLKQLIPTATGELENNRAIEEGQFEFTLTTLVSPKEEHKTYTETVQNKEGGVIDFKTIPYDLSYMNRDEKGVFKHPVTTFYQYKVVEKLLNPKDEEGGFDPTIDYNFDDIEYYVTVRLTYVKEKGANNKETMLLKAEKIYSTEVIDTTAIADDAAWAALVEKWAETEGTDFTNYDARTDITVEGHKDLEKEEGYEDIDVKRTIKPGEFEFVITTDPEGKNILKDANGKEYRTRNDKDGNFKFDKILYDLSDMDRDATEFQHPVETTYVYYVKEVKPAAGEDDFDPYVTYDESVYKMTVTLTYEEEATGTEATGTEATGTEATGTEATGTETKETKMVLKAKVVYTLEGAESGTDETEEPGTGTEPGTGEEPGEGGEPAEEAEEVTPAFKNYYRPSIEKYVNEDVHANLASYKKVFTYDIIAYITKDAVTTTITDNLISALMFRSTADEIKASIIDIGGIEDFLPTGQPDHTAHGTVSAHTGKPLGDAAAVTIDGKNLTIVIEDSKPYRGHWVQVTFDACLDLTVINPEDYTTYEALAEAIDNNGLVISPTYPSHEGVPNTANYTIIGVNQYDCESNTVTVTPPELGSMKIVKTLTNFVDEEAPTFVFDVKVYYNPDDPSNSETTGELVYGNVFQMAFTTYGEKSITIDKLPKGAFVKVEEIYEGARYEAVNSITSQTAVISADAVANVSFENEGNNNFGGHGILNEFIYGDDKKWQHERKDSGADEDNAPLE